MKQTIHEFTDTLEKKAIEARQAIIDLKDLKAVSDSEESVLHKSDLSESEMDLEEDKIRLLK